MKALFLNQFGGPEVLRYSDVSIPALTPGTVLVRTEAIGLNFADIYRRRGYYHIAGKAPFILGYEGAGVVEHVASDVELLKAGDRIAWADVPYSNAELVSVPIDHAIPIPEHITSEQAAAVLLQGLTAHYLVNDSYSVEPGNEILIHAAAGGVGQLLTQLCKSKGARVIGLTSTEAKRGAAFKAGADEVLLYDQNWANSVTQRTKRGMGVDAVYDSVGTSLMDSFAATKIKGTVVFYGMAGGDPPHIDPRMLMDTSKTLTGGDLWNHLTTSQDRIIRAESLFEAIRNGTLRLEEPMRFNMKQGAEAHRLLESRSHAGKILMIP